MTPLKQFIALAALLALPVITIPAQADDAPPSPVRFTEEHELYAAKPLEKIVSHIALYPDVVLASLLPASSSPADLVMAAHWIAKYKVELPEIPEAVIWDDDVKAMLQFPDIVTWMSEHVNWLDELGYAVTYQLEDVLAAIQRFRAYAEEAGNLKTDDKWVVTLDYDSLTVHPAKPPTLHVPKYDSADVTRPNYQFPFWAAMSAGTRGAWTFNVIQWDGRWGQGALFMHDKAFFNFDSEGNVAPPPPGGRQWRPPAEERRSTDLPERVHGKAPEPNPPQYDRAEERARVPKDGLKPVQSDLLRALPGRVGGTNPTRPRAAATEAEDGSGVLRATPGRRAGSRPVGAPRSPFANQSRNAEAARRASTRGHSSIQRR